MSKIVEREQNTKNLNPRSVASIIHVIQVFRIHPILRSFADTGVNIINKERLVLLVAENDTDVCCGEKSTKYRDGLVPSYASHHHEYRCSFGVTGGYLEITSCRVDISKLFLTNTGTGVRGMRQCWMDNTSITMCAGDGEESRRSEIIDLW